MKCRIVKKVVNSNNSRVIGKTKAINNSNWGKHDPLLEHLPTDKKSYPQGGITKVDVEKVIEYNLDTLNDIFRREGK